MQKFFEARGVDGAQVLLVIETKAMRGAGTSESILREVSQYWTLDGKFLAEHDPTKDEKPCVGHD